MGKKAANLPTGQSQYQVVGRYVPNEKYPEDNAQCKVYRMNLFAKNKVVARSRFWYFMGRLCRVKKANGQIISVSQVRREARACRCTCDGYGGRRRQGGEQQTGGTVYIRCGQHRWRSRVADAWTRGADTAGSELQLGPTYAHARRESAPPPRHLFGSASGVLLTVALPSYLRARADLREEPGPCQELWHLVPL